MEAFEHVVKVYLESRDYVVTTNVKFPVKRRTKKAEHPEYQTHGYEVDIVAAKHNSLLLGSVKSFFGSSGVSKQGFRGIANTNKATYYSWYKMFNEPDILRGILHEAENRYGYPEKQIKYCLFAGNFVKGDEELITEHLAQQGIAVYNVKMVIEGLLEAAKSKMYINDAVLVTVKALQQLKLIRD